MLVDRADQSQLILVENRADCRSGRFRLQVITARHYPFCFLGGGWAVLDMRQVAIRLADIHWKQI